MMSKPDLIKACRRLADQLAPADECLSAKLSGQLTAYEKNDLLGGVECARVAKTLGDVRLVIDPLGIQLSDIDGMWTSEWGISYSLESQAWEAFHF